MAVEKIRGRRAVAVLPSRVEEDRVIVSLPIRQPESGVSSVQKPYSIRKLPAQR